MNLAAFVLTALLVLPSHAQETARGISLFPGPHSEAVVPNAEAPVPPRSGHISLDLIGRFAGFTRQEAECVVGDVLGFFVGSVLRATVWAATIGDRVGSSEPLDRLGLDIVAAACWGPLSPLEARPVIPVLESP